MIGIQLADSVFGIFVRATSTRRSVLQGNPAQSNGKSLPLRCSGLSRSTSDGRADPRFGPSIYLTDSIVLAALPSICSGHPSGFTLFIAERSTRPMIFDRLRGGCVNFSTTGAIPQQQKLQKINFRPGPGSAGQNPAIHRTGIKGGSQYGRLFPRCSSTPVSWFGCTEDAFCRSAPGFPSLSQGVSAWWDSVGHLRHLSLSRCFRVSQTEKIVLMPGTPLTP